MLSGFSQDPTAHLLLRCHVLKRYALYGPGTCLTVCLKVHYLHLFKWSIHTDGTKDQSNNGRCSFVRLFPLIFLISLFIHLFIIHLKGFNFTSSIPGDISISTSSCRMTFPSQNSLKMSVSVQMNWTGDPKMSSISHRVFISAATGATRFLYIYMIYNMI